MEGRAKGKNLEMHSESLKCTRKMTYFFCKTFSFPHKTKSLMVDSVIIFKLSYFI